MCGRFVSPSVRDLERYFGTPRGHQPLSQLDITYNAAPSMKLPVVRSADGELVAEPMEWGFVPSWWKQEKPPSSTINARAEEAAEKPMWRSAVKYNRALIPALGYFEWKPGDGRKQPYYIQAPSKDVMCFAGLWSTWKDTKTFAILVTASAPSIAQIHDRMPLVLPQDAWKAWTDPDLKDGATALQAAQDAAVKEFIFHPISTYVNSPKNQGAQCIEPLIQ